MSSAVFITLVGGAAVALLVAVLVVGGLRRRVKMCWRLRHPASDSMITVTLTDPDGSDIETLRKLVAEWEADGWLVEEEPEF